jgi:arylsulfotransferase ASST/Ig-like domain-containing protein
VPLAGAVQGPEILDSQGRTVWFLQLPGIQLAADFRIQTYQGQQVLTWAQGPGFEIEQPGATTDYIYDNTYNLVATVQAGNGYNADEHEFQLTPQNTALITIYNQVPYDLSSIGGSANGYVLEGVAQEIDVATGSVVFEWHSLDHVALTESNMPVPTAADTPYDYFHINSVKLDTDGNLLISSRNTSTVYKVNRTTGAVIWRLGGKLSDFTLGPGLPFAYQHDVEAVNSTTLRIFDNESDGVPVLPASRVIWVTHDDTAMTATLLSSVQHPAGLSVLAEGSGQTLPNGDTFVDWGILGRYSEFDPNGNLLYDASMATGYSSYRGFRLPWVGAPTTSPAITVVANSNGTTTVNASWNGATQVATWNVMGGTSSASPVVVATAPWNGLVTPITLTTSATNLQVVAVDATGSTLGQSPSVNGPFAAAAPVITSQPVSQTVASGSTAVFSVGATGSPLTYSWSLSSVDVGVPDELGNSGVISGATGPTLVITDTQAVNAGTLTCTVSNSAGSVTTTPVSLAISSTSDVGRLVNVSCRAQVGTGANELITGFAVGGGDPSGSEPVLIRASGPALDQFSVPGTLPDPELQLFSVASGGVLLASDSGWGGSPAIASAAASAGAFAWTNPASLDSALVETLVPGPYTANISGASGDTGIALAEVYDETPAATFTPSDPHLINVSARAGVGTGANTLVAGFVIGGSTSRTVLIRGSGPALGQFSVPGTLPDPELQLFQSNSNGTSTLIQSNTGWGGNAQVAAAAASVGAFSWGATATPDSALLVTLPPGAYTAQVSGASGDTGVALAEVYELP